GRSARARNARSIDASARSLTISRAESSRALSASILTLPSEAMRRCPPVEGMVSMPEPGRRTRVPSDMGRRPGRRPCRADAIVLTSGGGPAMDATGDPDALPGDRTASRGLLDNDDPTVFPKLTDEQLALLAPYGHTRPIAVGDVLFDEGDPAYDFMVL